MWALGFSIGFRHKMKEIYYHFESDYSVGVKFDKNVKASFEFHDKEYPAYNSDVFDEQDFLEALAFARNKSTKRIYGKDNNYLDVSDTNLSFQSADRSVGGNHPINQDFDHFFLDSLSVIENGERKSRLKREISLGNVESGLLKILQNNPELVNELDPRVFEYTISVFLKKFGFSNVELTRYAKDNGVDIFAKYSDANKDFLVVVEVKQYGNNVGIEIADRICGAMTRNGADKALIVTSSSITSTVKKEYKAGSHYMACIDYQRIEEFLNYGSSNWVQSPSGLWTAKNILISP